GVGHLPAREGSEGEQLGVPTRLQAAGHQSVGRLTGQPRRQPAPPHPPVESLGPDCPPRTALPVWPPGAAVSNAILRRSCPGGSWHHPCSQPSTEPSIDTANTAR